jgi:hypothetical protein
MLRPIYYERIHIMTHFTVGIIVPPRFRNVHAYIARQMFGYDKNRESARTSIDHLGSRWDWYRIGGRFDGWITDNEQSSDNGFNFHRRHETVQNNIATTEGALTRNKLPCAVITPDGDWHDRGDLWQFGLRDEERQKCDERIRRILRKYPGHRIVIVDAHI